MLEEECLRPEPQEAETPVVAGKQVRSGSNSSVEFDRSIKGIEGLRRAIPHGFSSRFQMISFLLKFSCAPLVATDTGIRQ
ncbi:hypothetical protein WJX79_001184 [Trebouxia sp. C0005]